MDTFSTSAPGLRSAIDALVDERFGIIASVVQSPHERGEPAFFHFFATTAPSERWLARRPFAYGGGTSTNRDVAAAKAIGECVERYCSAVYDLDALLLAPAREAGVECVAPERFALFSREQYAARRLPYHPFTADTPVRWVPASRLLDGATVHVPAASVYLPYYGERRDEMPVIPVVSTGLAAGPDLLGASSSGILEVIERDAFCRTWYEHRSPPHFQRESMSIAVLDAIARFERCGYVIDLLDITSDLGVPVVLATARGSQRDAPALSVATSAALDPEFAAIKALEELAMTARYQRDLALSRHKAVDLAGDLHLAFWNERSRRELAAFLWASQVRVKLRPSSPDHRRREPQRGLHWLVHRLAERSFDALVCDITSPDIRALGLVVVRAVVPGLQPLLFGEGMVALGSDRLRAPHLNPLLHPFP